MAHLSQSFPIMLSVGRKKSTQTSECRVSAFGRHRLHVQQLQQDLPLEDWALQPQTALQFHHRLTSMAQSPLSLETDGCQLLLFMSVAAGFPQGKRPESPIRTVKCTLYTQTTIPTSSGVKTLLPLVDSKVNSGTRIRTVQLKVIEVST